MIRDGDFKLIEFYETGRVELFDLVHDFRENQNLAEDPAQTTRVQTLRAKLDDWRNAIGAQMMPPNPAYHPSPQATDGSITLMAEHADVHGVMLRYEPLPHKHTLGFWVNPNDWAHWEHARS